MQLNILQQDSGKLASGGRERGRGGGGGGRGVPFELKLFYFVCLFACINFFSFFATLKLLTEFTVRVGSIFVELITLTIYLSVRFSVYFR